MCYSTRSRHCYEILNPKCAKQMNTIGIHYKYIERSHCLRYYDTWVDGLLLTLKSMGHAAVS